METTKPMKEEDAFEFADRFDKLDVKGKAWTNEDQLVIANIYKTSNGVSDYVKKIKLAGFSEFKTGMALERILFIEKEKTQAINTMIQTLLKRMSEGKFDERGF